MKYPMFFRSRTALLTIAGFVLLVVAGAITYVVARPSPADQLVLHLGEGKASESQAPDTSGYTYRRLTAPDRTEIIDASGQSVAIMTDGARTAHIYGPSRTFQEPRFTKAKVDTNVWVRLAPQAWQAGAEKQEWFTKWFAAAREDRSPDVLGVAMEYVNGAPAKKDDQGRQFAGDASFGPLASWDPDGRDESSDFYDYLGMPWAFPDGASEVPEPDRSLAVDCSGYLRIVYGYRLGYPLRGTDTGGEGLPRRAFAMAEVGPGVQLMANSGVRARGLDRLLPGDLLFFNAGPVLDAHIEHSGIYMGVDDRGHHRFLSSRAQADGPTMGDLAGEPLLDGLGYWAERWRTARRL
jgi:cell wall-associated NlpC family hydrolase